MLPLAAFFAFAAPLAHAIREPVLLDGDTLAPAEPVRPPVHAPSEKHDTSPVFSSAFFEQLHALKQRRRGCGLVGNTVESSHFPQRWTRQLDPLVKIDAGSIGVIYKAQVVCNRTYYMVVKHQKMVKGNDVLKEIKMMEKFKGKRFINIYDYQVDSNYGDILMEAANGGSLFQYLYSDKLGDQPIDPPLPLGVRWQLFLEILRGTKEMHDSDYMHLDLKPENILVDANCFQERCHAKLADLGHSCSYDPPAELDSTMCKNELKGTPVYMAPEAWTKWKDDSFSHVEAYTKAADIWALGMMLYELVFRTLPQEMPLNPKNFDITKDPKYKKPSGIPDDPDYVKSLRALLEGMLKVNKASRWDATQVLEAAEKLATKPATKSGADSADDSDDLSHPPACWNASL